MAGSGHTTLESYLVSQDDPRLQVRVARLSNLPARYFPAPPRAGTSMLHMSSGASSLAALTSAATASTRGSVATSIGEREVPKGNLLESDEHGVLQIAPLVRPVVYYCTFPFLSCHNRFSDRATWLRHCLEHFGDAGPPRKTACCWCEASFERSTPRQNWEERMGHLELHFRLEHSLSHARPDFAMFRYLYEEHIIGNALYKELKGGSAGSGSGGGGSRSAAAMSTTSLRVPIRAAAGAAALATQGPVITMNSSREDRQRRPRRMEEHR